MITTASMPIAFEPDGKSASPLYLQLAQALGAAIRAGAYQAHEALPSERALAEALGVSRVTARKAIACLVEQGRIVRRHGSGNYIAPKIEQPLSRLTSFTEELRQRGFVPQSRWLQRAIATALPEEQLALGLGPGQRVARLERLRLADGVVMAHELSVLPEDGLPAPQAVVDSLYEHLEARGDAPVRALQHIRAVNADARLAGLLAVPQGAAVLLITRVGYLASGKPVELTHSHCRADYYDFVAELRREPN